MKKERVDWGKECVILTRVSTKKQTLSPQELALIEFSKTKGFNKYHTIQTTESGFKTIESKEGFKMVREFLENNSNCRTILVTEMSRLGRNSEVLGYINKYLKDKTIQLIIRDINFELFDEYGNITVGNEIIFSLFAAMAESEMRQKKERFSIAKKSNFAEGFSIIGKELFGYKRVWDENRKKNTYAIDEIKANEIRCIYNWYLNGIDGDTSKSSISALTNECIIRGFSPYLQIRRNLNKALKERAYVGLKTTHNRKKNPEYWDYGMIDKPKYVNCESMTIKYPEILTDNIFEQVQEKLSYYSTRLERNIDNNKFIDKSTKHITICSKLIVCPICNHFFRGEYRIKDGYMSHFYRCSHSKTNNGCNNKTTFSMGMLDSSIWQFIKDNISNLIEKLTEFYSNTDREEITLEIERLKERIIDYEKDIDTEIDIYRTVSKRTNDKSKAKSEFNKRTKQISDEINKLNVLIKQRDDVLIDLDLNYNKNIESEIKNNIIEIQNSKEKLRKYIRLLIKRIEPLYSNNKYSVFKITSIESLGSYFKFSTQTLVKKESECVYFLLIDKTDNHRIKIRAIENQNVKFNDCRFVLNNFTTTIEGAFKIPILSTLDKPFRSTDSKTKKVLEQTALSFSLTEIPYEKLVVYETDNPKQKQNLLNIKQNGGDVF